MIQGHGRIVGGQANYGLTPQHRSGQNIGLVDAGEPPPARGGPLQRVLRYALHFGNAVNRLVACDLGARLHHRFVPTKINVAGQLADDFQIAVDDPIEAQWRNCAKRFAQAQRT